MAGEDYRTEEARLIRRLDELRLDHAPADWLANVLTNLIQLHLSHQNPSAARRSLGELDGLRRPGEPLIEAEYYLGAARVAAQEGEAARAVWFAERAITLGRRHQPADFVGVALLALADALEPLGREEESRKARLEAVERFEQAGRLDHASAVLVSLNDGFSYDESERGGLERAVALAQRAEGPHAKAWAFKALGRWHLAREEYLPARRALERALAFARQHDDASDVSGCLAELARLEADAFHHHEALALATDAAQAAPTPAWKAYALEVKEMPLYRLHQHAEARAVLLEVARCYDEAGDPESAQGARLRARGQRIITWLRRLPAWVYRPPDHSTREAAARTRFQPLGFWLGSLAFGALLLWTQVFVAAAADAHERFWSRVLLVVAMQPWLYLFAFALLVLRDQTRARRRDGEA